MIGMQEVIVIALIILLLFGGKKIPELMKGLGQGVKSFKNEMNGVVDSDNPTTTDKTQSPSDRPTSDQASRATKDTDETAQSQSKLTGDEDDGRTGNEFLGSSRCAQSGDPTHDCRHDRRGCGCVLSEDPAV